MNVMGGFATGVCRARPGKLLHEPAVAFEHRRFDFSRWVLPRPHQGHPAVAMPFHAILFDLDGTLLDTLDELEVDGTWG